MQLVPSTAIVLFLIALMLRQGPYRGLVLLMAMAPFGMMAAFNLPAVGGTSIVALDLAVVAMFFSLALRRRGFDDMLDAFGRHGAGIWLALFVGYATVATLFFPAIFAGQTEVFSIGREANSDGIVSAPLAPGTGNLSQLMRMYLSVAGFAVAHAAMRRRPDAGLALRAMQAATLVHLALGLADILTNAAGLTHLMEPIRTANYALTLGQKMGGLNRMIGGFPEASAYGFFSMGMLGFWLSYWFSYRGTSRAPAVFLAIAVFEVLRCTSSSAYVAAVGLLITFAVVNSVRAGAGGYLSARSATIIFTVLALLPLMAAGAYMAYALLPGVTEFVDRSLLTKLSSDSGTERMSWNAQALRNFADTLGLGAGLGSVRASNWVVACLACTGLIGTFAFLAFAARLVTAHAGPLADTRTRNVIRALQWGCGGFLMRAFVVQGTPNLQIYFFAMAGMGLALVAASRAPVQAGHSPAPLREARA